MKDKTRKILILVFILILVGMAAEIAVYMTYHLMGHVRDSETSIGTSQVYTEKEIRDAAEDVEDYFKKNFAGCKLRYLSYDEDRTWDEQLRWAEKYGEEQAIILYSEYVPYYVQRLGSAEPMTDFRWILTRSGGKWTLRVCGYEQIDS